MPSHHKVDDPRLGGVDGPLCDVAVLLNPLIGVGDEHRVVPGVHVGASLMCLIANLQQPRVIWSFISIFNIRTDDGFNMQICKLRTYNKE